MKNLTFTQATFIQSAANEEDFPKLLNPSGKEMPEIAMIGRSNVGKSSLINHLLRQKKLAKISSTPGKTQLINFFTVNQLMSLVDLPGYGHAKVPIKLKNQWGQSIETYLSNRAPLKLLVLLLDIRRVPNEDDLKMIQWAQFHSRPFLVVFTKMDKIKRSEREECLKNIQSTLLNETGLNEFKSVEFSIKEPGCRFQLMEMIKQSLS